MQPTIDWAHAHCLDDVLERMDLIDQSLPTDDGVAVFNRMYRSVTRLVDESIDDGFFEAGDFLYRLDVHFANLFFEAYAADAIGNPVPRAWRPLFEHREKPNTHPVQFALAGMNAHISHDLPYAVVSTCRESGLAPVDDTPHHHDYTQTNLVLEQGYGEIRSWFHTGVVAFVDDVGGKVDDALTIWGISLARAGAWMASQTLWELDDNPRMLDLFSRGHRRAVELTSRGILI